MGITRRAFQLRPPRRLAISLGLVAAAAAFAGAIPGAATVSSVGAATAPLGYDVSWPNCSVTPPSTTGLAIVGVTGGRAFTTNPCFRAEYLAGRSRGMVRFYLNLNSPKGTIGMTGPAGRCSTANLSCQAFNYGYRAASAAWTFAAGQIGVAPLRTGWWLDIETSNTWSTRTAVNARVVAGALQFLRSGGHADRVGIYSTNYQWRTIAGTYRPGVPVWYATVARTTTTAAGYCRSTYAFTGGFVRMVQFQPGGIDRDYLCR